MASAIALTMLLICCNWGGVSAQSLTVTGVVTDETGEPLIGATVQEKGTSNGTAPMPTVLTALKPRKVKH